MKPFLIVKTGSTYPQITRKDGDFEDWIADTMRLDVEQWQCVNVQAGEKLPEHATFAGCIITGSHAMVTDQSPWVQYTAAWVREAVATGLPMFGICFGHQLMADALGGKAGDHPEGIEIGTVPITLTGKAKNDPLFSQIPDTFPAHVTHSQTALRLPPKSVLLAASGHDPHQAFRIGKHAWGVQFHPEFDAEATESYVRILEKKLDAEGLDAEAIFDSVRETADSARILRLFAEYCRNAV